MIDLHCHSTFSDGSFEPEELVELAAQVGLSALALTDHDTTDGVPSFTAVCDKHGITAVAGVEISVEFSPGTMHMLGYFVDLDNAQLQSDLRNVRDGRAIRNRKIFERLQELGMELDWDEILELAGDAGVVGRPHFAQAMISRGYAADKSEVFNSWLAKGKPGYVDRIRLSPQDGIASIRAAGGVPVLAHPFSLKLNNKELKAVVAGLAGDGLQGIEVFYPMHKPDQLSFYLQLCKEFGLTATGGSDFHGAGNPDIQLGSGFGNISVRDSVLTELQARLS